MSGYDKRRKITVFIIPNLYFQKIRIPYRFTEGWHMMQMDPTILAHQV